MSSEFPAVERYQTRTGSASGGPSLQRQAERPPYNFDPFSFDLLAARSLTPVAPFSFQFSAFGFQRLLLFQWKSAASKRSCAP